MSTRRVESFLLRLVAYEGDNMDPEHWRGRIQHVGSGYECQFEQLQEIVNFIREHTAGERGGLLTYEIVPGGE